MMNTYDQTNLFNIVRYLASILLIINLSNSDGYKLNSDEGFIFPYWTKMNRLNKDIMMSEDHRAYVDIYVNNIGMEDYVRESEKFKIGSVIVKPLYPEARRENISKIMIMMKMEDNYDSKNGNWWYGVYDKSGLIAFEEGKIESCIICHESARDTDYLFSESVMFRIKSKPIFKIKDSIHKPK